MNDTVRFVDILVDILNDDFNPDTLGRVDSIYRELTFAILADFICVSHIDIWNLWVNGQWSVVRWDLLLLETQSHSCWRQGIAYSSTSYRRGFNAESSPFLVFVRRGQKS